MPNRACHQVRQAGAGKVIGAAGTRKGTFAQRKRKEKKMSQEREGVGEGAATEHDSGQPEKLEDRMGPRENFPSA